MVAGTAVTLALWLGAAFGWWGERSPGGISAGVWGLGANLLLCFVLSRWSRAGTVAGSEPLAGSAPRNLR
jgi:hypothetical protein